MNSFASYGVPFSEGKPLLGMCTDVNRFVVCVCKSSLCVVYVYAQIPCTDLVGPLMYDPVWEAVARLVWLSSNGLGDLTWDSGDPIANLDMSAFL